MRKNLPFALLAVCAAVLPDFAFAYIGPGAGLSAFGTLAAFGSALVLAIVGFVWYPVKRLLAALRNRKEREQGEE